MPPLRFVILRHEGINPPHFDLMFESSPGSDLRTFRCFEWPPNPGADLLALANHRRAYLEYEGPVSGNRGQVRRVLSGTCQLLAPTSGTRIIHIREPQPLEIRIEQSEQASDVWRVVSVSA